jgi:hypothetical protein
MPRNGHVRFGGRVGETGQRQRWNRAPARPDSQERVRSMTQRRAVNPGSFSIAFFSSPRERMWR